MVQIQGHSLFSRTAWFGATFRLCVDIDYELLAALAVREHPLLHIADDWQAQILETPLAWTGEIMAQARVAHHLLDMADVPHGIAYASDLDSRTYLAVIELIALRRQAG
jgi:hypothetical protein